jgi:cell division protein FtsQ
MNINKLDVDFNKIFNEINYIKWYYIYIKVFILKYIIYMDGEVSMDKPVKKSNELIRRRKRKIMIKRSILTLIFLMIVLVTLCLKLPYFAVETIVVENNKYIDSEIITSLSGINKGNNIFYINTKRSKSKIGSNAYISYVDIDRKFPNTILINVKEREATLYLNLDNKYIILDKEGFVLEISDSIENLKLVKVDGIKASNIEVGKQITIDELRVKKVLAQFADLIKRNKTDIKFDNIELNSLSDIKVFCAGLCFKLGDSYEIENKLNKALNIATNDEIIGKKGYIDVSFEGSPVVYIE